MLTLTKAELASLTPSEQQCAKMLGLDAGSLKRTRKSHSKCTSGESYILVTAITCRLCSFVNTQVFQMFKQGSLLHGREISEVPTKDKLGKMKVKKSCYTVKSCKNCYSYLENFKKEDLIKRFLSYINDGRNFLT